MSLFMSSCPHPIFSTSPPPPTKSLSPFQARSPFPSGSDALKLPLLHLRFHWTPCPLLLPAPLSLPLPCPVDTPRPFFPLPYQWDPVHSCVWILQLLPSFLSPLGGVHSQRSCCSEMWRQLLRDSETSVPGPRGKKRERKRKRGGEEREGRGGRGRPGGSHKPQQPQHQAEFLEKSIRIL